MEHPPNDLQTRIDYYENILRSVYLSPEWKQAYEDMWRELVELRDGPPGTTPEDS